MVELSNPSRSPSPRPHSNHSSAIVAGRFVVSDAALEETLATASSPTKLTSSSSKRRIAGRFIVADEDMVVPNQVNQQSRFEILDLPVVPEGREYTGEPLSSVLRNLIDRVSVRIFFFIFAVFFLFLSTKG